MVPRLLGIFLALPTSLDAVLFGEPKYQIKFGLDNIDDIIENLVEKIKFLYNDFSIGIDIDIKDITIKLFDLI